MQEKLLIIRSIFSAPLTEELDDVVQHGNFYGGVYNGRKYMYSQALIETLTPEKLERFIKKQIGI